MDLARPDRSRTLDALAAEHALGTLPLRVRRRLAAIARREPVIATALQQWEYRLAGLAEAVPAVEPAPKVWARIRDRLDIGPSPQSAQPAQWWSNLGLWRGLTAAGFALALTLAISLATLNSRDTGEADAVVIVLAGADARPALVASGGRTSRTLSIKALAPLDVAAGRTLELWALPRGGNPLSLGVLGTGGIMRVTLRQPAGSALENVPALAVSLEPSGGSPTGQPTGPVLYSGAVQRLY